MYLNTTPSVLFRALDTRFRSLVVLLRQQIDQFTPFIPHIILCLIYVTVTPTTVRPTWTGCWPVIRAVDRNRPQRREDLGTRWKRCCRVQRQSSKEIIASKDDRVKKTHSGTPTIRVETSRYVLIKRHGSMTDDVFRTGEAVRLISV